MTVEQMHGMTTEREKSEKQERQRFEALWWGGALIWAGLVFGADYLGILPQIGKADAWTWVFLGAGLYGVVGDVYRLTSPGLLNPAAWDWIWSGFLLVVGLSGVIVTDMYWPLVLVLVGAVILVNTLRRR